MANQSKMQLSLLDMEPYELFLIAVVATFMQLKMHNKRRKHRLWVHGIMRNRLQQGAYYNLVKELPLDEEKFQQYFRLTREQFAHVFEISKNTIKKYM